MDTNQALFQLKAFVKREKFVKEEWVKMGLNPSSTSVAKELTLFFNDCGNQLVAIVPTEDKENRYISILKQALSTLKVMDYNRGEKELITAYFYELSQIVDVNISKDLNRWLYGWFVGFLINTFGPK